MANQSNYAAGNGYASFSRDFRKLSYFSSGLWITSIYLAAGSRGLK